jgi:hypothetical protein
MKAYSFLFIALLFTVFSCSETKSVVPTNQCFEVSYVKGICGQSVLRIENPAFFKFGETWNGYENVFYTVFDCSVDEGKLKQANFFVQIRQDPANPNIQCVMCTAALDYQGSKKYFVDVVGECNSDSGD